MSKFYEDRQVDDTILDMWRGDGFALIEGFFSKDELEPVVEDYGHLHPAPHSLASQSPAHMETGSRIGHFSREQFRNMLQFPFEASVATNLLCLHPALMETARRALGVEQVFMYRGHTWAKFTGNADYAQEFHMDFTNHTLLVPPDEKCFGTVNFVVYLTDVTEGHGAMRYVPSSAARQIDTNGVPLPDEEAQHELKCEEHIATAPAGSLVIYDTDVYHRGANLTVPGGIRYTMTVSYRAQGYEAIGGNPWARAGGHKSWADILQAATVDQLAALGIPRPGHLYWTRHTLARVASRYPGWDLTPFRASLELVK